MFKCTRENGAENKVTLKISGDVTIHNSGEMHRLLLELLDTADSVELALTEMGDVDMSFFQLLCSAHRTFTLKDKLLCVTGDMNSLLDENNFSGYARIKGCSNDKFKNCVLVKEK